MSLYFRYHWREIKDYYPIVLFTDLQNKLQQQYDIKFQPIDNNFHKFGQGSIFSCMHMSIINADNNKYILISLFDHWKTHFFKYFGWQPELMTQFLYGAGFNYLEYFYFKYLYRNNTNIYLPNDIDTKYHQFFYHTYYTNHDNIETDLFNTYNMDKTLPQLYFRGYMWNFRSLMSEYLLNNKDIIIIDKNINNNNYDYITYLKDLKNYRCALSLPGGTEICNRDIECFAIGVPVIRPTILTNYPDPLIPDYHYINCYGGPRYFDHKPKFISYKDFSNNVIDTWNRVKNNIDYLNFIAKNAREWYKRNCTLEANSNYILSKINISSLYN